MRFRRESRGGLARGGWSGPLWKITKLYVYLGITGMIDPQRKSQNNIHIYPASIQCRVIIGPPAKTYLNDDLLTG